MSKSVWVLGPLFVATVLAASSCSSEDSDPQGSGGADGAGAQGGGSVGGARSTGGQGGVVAAAGATGGVTWMSGGNGSGGVSFATTALTQGGMQTAPSTSGGVGGGVGAAGGSPSTGGQSDSKAGAGGTAVNSAGAAGIAGIAGTAGTAGTTAVQDPRCAVADVAQTLTANLKITADNECDVYVNGQSVGQTSSWSSAVTIDVSLYVHPGRKNVVAVVGRNTSSQGGIDRGIIGQLTTTVGTTITPILVTNSEWVVSQSPGTNWTLLDYDASTWIPATEVANAGDAPWGNVMGAGSEAKWIWFAPVPNSTAEKPNQETTYSRRVFYFDFDGHVVATPACESPVP